MLSLKFLILNNDYPAFLRRLDAQHPGLEKHSCDKQMCLPNESLFGLANFYSSNLRKLEHEAWNIHVNNKGNLAL